VVSTPKVSFIEIARAAYVAGLRRFVVIHPGLKKPIELDWQETKPLENIEQIPALLGKHPANCNCGAVTSKAANLLLDFDDPQWLMENWPGKTLPDTLLVKTGRGRAQMHFLQTDLSREKLRNASLKNPRARSSENVLEVKFNNQQGLLPGCFVRYDDPTLGLYTTYKNSPVTPIPDYVVEWIVKLLDKTSPALKPGQIRPVRPDLDLASILRAAGVKYGDKPLERDGRLYFNHHKEMGCLVKGAPHTDDSNKNNNRTCAFVLDLATGRLWYQCFDSDCQATPQKTKRALAAVGLSLEDLLVEHWRRFFDSKADFERAGDLVWQIEGISYQGEATGNVALQKNGKSWFILSKIKALLSDLPDARWMGHKVAKATRVILFIPEVGRASMYRRLKLMKLDQYLDKTLFVRTSALGVPDLEDTEVLNACAGADVFMDTLIRFLEGPENNAEVINTFAEKVFALLAVARNVEINAHTLKNYDTAVDMGPAMFRGSGDITAFLSNGYGLMQVDRLTNKIFVKCLFSRDLPEDVPNFVIEGRPWIDEESDFRLVDGNAGELKDNKTDNRLKNATAEQLTKLREMHAARSDVAVDG
jgi:hypothetical protein